jgi:hypothetical protein
VLWRERRVARVAAEIARLRRGWPGMTLRDAVAVNHASGLVDQTRAVGADEPEVVGVDAYRLRGHELRWAWDLASEALGPS